eukprot:Phypoly_transcript_01244.p1 GENE.Phypoly_transcript_01244~~Phypoly_transcript_01244.p1  ORF type:complete len:1086 (+),score=113.52 Phypoly_transcript_01244:74-3331(+)
MSLVPKVVHQKHLEQVLHKLFPGLNVFVNTRKETSITNPSTGYFLELDLWIPDLNLCFEFQDAYHYAATWKSPITLESIHKTDSIKHNKVRIKNDTLVYVPCWWDGEAESLAATIGFHRPEIVHSLDYYASSIPINPPLDMFKLDSVPGVGELMRASHPTSVYFTGTISPEHPWWLGEKYDGIRCCWNPETKQFYTRTGFELYFPQAITAALCAHPNPRILEGEMWFGRGSFPETQKIVYSELHEISWSSMRYVVFDIPTAGKNSLPFEKRFRILIAEINYGHPFEIVVSRVLCSSKKQLVKSLRLILAEGGEGAILRRPGSKYEHGRSNHLFKLKAARGDHEALVMEVEDKALVLKLPDGLVFEVGEDQFDPELKPKSGDVVSFSYDNYSRNAVPVNPFVYRIRMDLTWLHVVRNHYENATQSQRLNDSSNQKVFRATTDVNNDKRSSQGNEQSATKEGRKLSKIRNAAEKMARSVHMDPLLSETWYSITRLPTLGLLRKKFGLAQLHDKMEYGGWIPLIIKCFPDLNLDPSKFHHLPIRFWDNLQNRRNSLLKFAERVGFDALVASNWYQTIRQNDFVEGSAMLKMFYKGSLAKALLHLFPEIDVDLSKFEKTPQGYWQSEAHRRKFLDQFADDRGFDPLLASNWYSVQRGDIFKVKGIMSLLDVHGSFVQAVIDLYPEVEFDQHKFTVIKRNSPINDTFRRKFFEDFAREQGFDPLIAANWRKVKTDVIEKRKGAYRVLKPYDRKLSKALAQLFPDIGINREVRAPRRKPSHWRTIQNRREPFLEFAKKNNFDPLVPENWYRAKSLIRQDMSGFHAVLKHYEKSVVKALLHLFPNIGLKKDKFKARSDRDYWQSIPNRRNFFVDFATTRGLDPLIADMWYSVSRRDVALTKGGEAILDIYGSLPEALQQLFPEVTFQVDKFPRVPNDFWKKAENRRKFFDSAAEKLGFDPLNPDGWYSVFKQKILDFKGKETLLQLYDGNLIDAIMDVYPDIGLEKSKFLHQSRSIWQDDAQRRLFFEQFALVNEFDPANKENWYHLPRTKLKAAKGFHSVMAFYNGSTVAALCHLFPELHLEPRCFDSRIT